MQACCMPILCASKHTYPTRKHGLAAFRDGEGIGNTGPGILLRVVVALQSAQLGCYDRGRGHEGRGRPALRDTGDTGLIQIL